MAQAVAQQQEVLTEQRSALFVRNLARAAISSICFMRNIFPNECFKDLEVGGSPLKSLQPSTPESRQMLSWFEKGVVDAINRRYLKTLVLGIYSIPSEPVAGSACGLGTMLESYFFSFSYDQTSGDPSVDVGCSGTGRQQTLVSKAKQQAKAAIQTMLRTIISLTQTMSPLPEERYISMKLLYYEDATPPEYQPPTFRPADPHEMRMFSEQTFTAQLGTLKTPFHEMTLRLRAGLGAFGTADAEHIAAIGYPVDPPTSELAVPEGPKPVDKTRAGDAPDASQPADAMAAATQPLGLPDESSPHSVARSAASQSQPAGGRSALPPSPVFTTRTVTAAMRHLSMETAATQQPVHQLPADSVSAEAARTDTPSPLLSPAASGAPAASSAAIRSGKKKTKATTVSPVLSTQTEAPGSPSIDAAAGRQRAKHPRRQAIVLVASSQPMVTDVDKVLSNEEEGVPDPEDLPHTAGYHYIIRDLMLPQKKTRFTQSELASAHHLQLSFVEFVLVCLESKGLGLRNGKFFTVHRSVTSADLYQQSQQWLRLFVPETSVDEGPQAPQRQGSGSDGRDLTSGGPDKEELREMVEGKQADLTAAWPPASTPEPDAFRVPATTPIPPTAKTAGASTTTAPEPGDNIERPTARKVADLLREYGLTPELETLPVASKAAHGSVVAGGASTGPTESVTIKQPAIADKMTATGSPRQLSIVQVVDDGRMSQPNCMAGATRNKTQMLHPDADRLAPKPKRPRASTVQDPIHQTNAMQYRNPLTDPSWSGTNSLNPA